MKIEFYKYQGTGNDFVMLNNMDGRYDGLSIDAIRLICDRKMGVGADGLISINKDDVSDFYVDYYNSDGSQSFCGNGGRCSVAFARHMGIIRNKTSFNAIDGIHQAEFMDGEVKLEMCDVNEVTDKGGDFVLNTGSPHYIRIAEGDEPGIVEFGKQIRYSPEFKEEGINVNIVSLQDGGIKVETYERGVEDETLSCGTGVTAAALIAMKFKEYGSPVSIKTKGGDLKVYAESGVEGFKNIWLQGPAKFVFTGMIDV